jgi:hypothetical protein
MIRRFPQVSAGFSIVLLDYYFLIQKRIGQNLQKPAELEEYAIRPIERLRRATTNPLLFGQWAKLSGDRCGA